MRERRGGDAAGGTDDRLTIHFSVSVIFPLRLILKDANALDGPYTHSLIFINKAVTLFVVWLK